MQVQEAVWCCLQRVTQTDISLLQIPVGKDFRLSGKAVKRAITSNTILVVASSPGFPHGVVDHVQDIAQVSTMQRTGGMVGIMQWVTWLCKKLIWHPSAEELCSASHAVRAVLLTGLCYRHGAYPWAARWRPPPQVAHAVPGCPASQLHSSCRMSLLWAGGVHYALDWRAAERAHDAHYAVRCR